MKIKKTFSDFARLVAHFSGHPVVFVIACLSIIIWLISGPIFAFSDTWQLIINTGTTIVTFLMVFLIQNTQNRDGEAIQIKLDELLRAHKGAHNALLDLEELSEEQLRQIKDRYEKLAKISRKDLSKGKKDTTTRKV